MIKVINGGATMQIDKNKFGNFIAEKRKSLNITQKELANRLFISDKAISKWERGLSLPDINLIIPIAEALNVNVSELLESDSSNPDKKWDNENVENMLQKVIFYNEAAKNKSNKKDRITFIVVWLVSLLDNWSIIYELSLNYWIRHGFIFALMGTAIGIYFYFIVRPELPAYYDENEIDFVNDGFMRFQIHGIPLNNYGLAILLGLFNLIPILYLRHLAKKYK